VAIGNAHASATVDAENIETILAADVKKWYVQSESSIFLEVDVRQYRTEI
jgi:hypothetical protein